jgi:exoribonuclease R
MNYHKNYININDLTEDVNIQIYEKQENIKNNRAIYGDEVYILNNEVINIKTRTNKKIVGILYMDSITQYGINSSGYPIYLCKPLNNKYEHFYIASSKKEKIKMYVVFEFKEWNEKQRVPHGQVLEYLGKVGEEDSEYEMLRYYHELNFNRWRLSNEELNEKRELIKEEDNIDYEVFSIDPIGSIDIDDAFHYKYIDEKNFEIGVHIASPTKYIENSEDWIKILSERISTVYLINKKYNVLPNELADDLCSLLENKKRFAISIIYQYEIGDKIELKNWYFRESIVKNRKNYRYEDVDDMIEKNFKKCDKEMKQMYLKTKEIFNFEDLDSHKYVELWMIKTNEMVAKYLVNHLEDPNRTILRVCLPNKIIEREKELKIMENTKIKKYLERREMKSALYQYYNKDKYMGHSMMNLDLYTHFTSPIRRSVDFYIHLLLLNKSVEKYDLDKVNIFVKRTRRLDRDLKRMNYIFKMKNNEVKTEVKGYLMEMTENFIKVYIPEYEMEEKYFIKDRIGYSNLKKIDYEYDDELENKKINKIKIDDKEYNLYEERDIKIWVFTKEDNFMRKLKIDIL